MPTCVGGSMLLMSKRIRMWRLRRVAPHFAKIMTTAGPSITTKSKFPHMSAEEYLLKEVKWTILCNNLFYLYFLYRYCYLFKESIVDDMDEYNDYLEDLPKSSAGYFYCAKKWKDSEVGKHRSWRKAWKCSECCLVFLKALLCMKASLHRTLIDVAES